ncbi:DUF6758 family protein, partial [Streptomyces sp. BE147]|uniref:DUF6758 family protein n=1 Tax=Streptomyces sp. BE147 TaxID=3002524 RepID=UPI003FA7E5A5
IPPSVEALGVVVHRAQVPVWMPWPLPVGWLFTGVASAGDDRSGGRAKAPRPQPRPVGGVGEFEEAGADVAQLQGNAGAVLSAVGPPGAGQALPEQKERPSEPGAPASAGDTTGPDCQRRLPGCPASGPMG